MRLGEWFFVFELVEDGVVVWMMDGIVVDEKKVDLCFLCLRLEVDFGF